MSYSQWADFVYYNVGDIANYGSVAYQALLSNRNVLPTTLAPNWQVFPVIRVLNGTPVVQPVIQYGQVSGNGNNGSTTVTLPAAYSSTGGYVIQASMADTPAAETFTTPLTPTTFTLGWEQAGGGNHTLFWTTFGL